MSLKQQIEAQKTAIAEFETALQALELPAQFHPENNQPLSLLKAVLAAETDEKGKVARRKQAETALDQAKSHLATLEAQWTEVESRSQSGAAKLEKTADRVNQLSEQLSEALAELKQVANEHEADWLETYGQSRFSEMVQRAMDLPFVHSDSGKHTLTTKSNKAYLTA